MNQGYQKLPTCLGLIVHLRHWRRLNARRSSEIRPKRYADVKKTDKKTRIVLQKIDCVRFARIGLYRLSNTGKSEPTPSPGIPNVTG